MAIKELPLQREQGQTTGNERQPSQKQIVQRVVIPHAPRRRFLRAIGGGLRLSGHQPRALIGYAAAALGVALATLCIGLVTAFFHVNNLSLIYLPVVLWLAVAFGRRPAILASFLAFLAYDFFFVPPLYRFTVDDPAQWISLLALLATALVIGQLTATVQAHVQEALASQQRTARLYALTQMIASTTDEEQLLQGLVQQVTQVFASSGVAAAALIVPDAQGTLVTRTVTPAGSPAQKALNLEVREQAFLARWALQHGAPVGQDVSLDQEGGYTVFYVPLLSSHRVLGLLGIAGSSELHCLVTGRTLLAVGAALNVAAERERGPQAQLFLTFCGQMALALERLALQQQAIHAEALRESDHLKNVLLGSVTHDLRTPLSAIKAATSSLLQPGMTWQEKDRLEFIESIDASVDRLNQLVSNLLDLSQLESGTAQPEKDWHLIGDVIATVLDRLDLAGQTRNRKIEVEVPESLPLALLDHGQIERVLTNLIENALKYSPPQSSIRVQARVVGNPGELEVRVSDQGIGIAADQLKLIFDKFYRVPQVRLPWADMRSPAGTGLGLAICANIIRVHQGRIWAESRPGEGSSFLFTLPIPADRPSGELPELAPSARGATIPTMEASDEQRTSASASAP